MGRFVSEHAPTRRVGELRAMMASSLWTSPLNHSSAAACIGVVTQSIESCGYLAAHGGVGVEVVDLIQDVLHQVKQSGRGMMPFPNPAAHKRASTYHVMRCKVYQKMRQRCRCARTAAFQAAITAAAAAATPPLSCFVSGLSFLPTPAEPARGRTSACASGCIARLSPVHDISQNHFAKST